MIRAASRRFIPAAVFFLTLCVSVLFLAATSTLVPVTGRNLPELRADIVSAFLR